MLKRTKGRHILRHIQSGNTVFRRRCGYRRRGLRRPGSCLWSVGRCRSLRQGGVTGGLVIYGELVSNLPYPLNNAVINIAQIPQFIYGHFFQFVTQPGFKPGTRHSID